MANGQENPFAQFFASETERAQLQEQVGDPQQTGDPFRKFFLDEGGNPKQAQFEFVIPEPEEHGPTVAQIAARGFSRGSTFPLQIFGVEQKPSLAETGGEKVASFVGELVGFGVSYIPFSAGAGHLLKGVGFLKKLSAPVQKAISGTAALGAFEAFGAESLEEAPVQFIKGALIGGAIEGIMVARAIRNRGKLPAPGGAVAHQDLIAIERELGLTEHIPEDQLSARLKALGDEAAQYDEVLSDIGQTYNPNGFRVIPGLMDPERLIIHAKRQNPKLQTATHKRPDGTSTVLLFDPAKGNRFVAQGGKSLETSSIYGTGGRITNFEEALAYVRRDLPGERFPPPDLTFDPDLAAVRNSLGIAYGDGRIILQSDHIGEFQTLVHEFTHFLTRVSSTADAVKVKGKLGGEFAQGGIGGAGIGGANISGKFRQIFSLSDETLASEGFTAKEILDLNLFSGFEKLDPKNLPKMVEELKRATVETELIKRTGGGQGPAGANIARNLIREEIEKNWKIGYTPTQGWGSDQELMARLVELMAYNPLLARAVAPRMSRLMGRFINKQSPKMQMMLAREDWKAFDQLIGTVWRQSPRGEIRLLEDARISLSTKQLQQFAREEGVSGMAAFHKGKMYEWGGLTRARKDHVRLRDQRTGKSFEVLANEVERPLLGRMVAYGGEVQGKLAAALAKENKWVGFAVKHPGAGIQRGIIDLSNIEIVTLGRSVMNRMTGEVTAVAGTNPFVAYAQKNRGTVLGTSKESGFAFSKGEELRSIVLGDLETRGLDGMAVFDQGILTEVHLVNQKPVLLGERLGNSFGISVDDVTYGPLQGAQAADLMNKVGGPEFIKKQMSSAAELGQIQSIKPSFRNGVESLLRQEGVADREISFFIEEAEKLYGDALMALVDPEFKSAMDLATGAAFGGSETLASQAARLGLVTERVADGVLVRSGEKQTIAKFATEKEARDYISRLQTGVVEDPLRSAQSPTSFGAQVGGGGGAGKLKPQQLLPDALPKEGETPIWRKIVNSWSIGLPWMNSMSTFATAAEESGFGAAFTKIFRPTQIAMQLVDNAIAFTKRPTLGGRSFKDVFTKLDKMTARMPTEQRENIVRYVEAMSKEEIAQPGGLLTRGMTTLELETADLITRAGLGHDVPRLMATNRAIGLFLEDREKFLTQTLPKLQQKTLQGQATTAEMKYLEEFKNISESVTTKAEAMADLGMTTEERWMIGMLDKPPSGKIEEYSIMAVSRYTAAPALKKGFKTGRQQFAVENGLSKTQLEAAKEIEAIFTESFAGSGLDARRMIGGYFPHYRNFSEFMGVGAADDAFRDVIPEGLEWVSQRVRMGEIDIYEMDPVLTPLKHVRNMLLKQHLDPLMPEIGESLLAVKGLNERVGRIMEEYIFEITGRPHKSFQAISDIIKTLGQMWGFEVEPRVAEKYVNAMVRLAHQAAIPFRPALVLRNSWQSPQMTIPFIGARSYFAGMKKTFTREGFDQSIAAGAIDLNVTPVFAGDQQVVFGGSVMPKWAAEKMGPALRELGFQYRNLFDKGFAAYRTPDDIGRAIAFHGSKDRQQRFLGRYLKDPEYGLEQFATDAKVRIHNEPIELEWKRLITAGEYEKAGDLLGVDLAQMTHFRYGHANHPAGWNSAPMKLLGQFGTFPVQYKDLLMQGSSRGTMKDKVEFFTGHIALNAALVVGGAELFGVDLWDWTAMPSLNYSGGPYADIGINLLLFQGGSVQEQRLGRRNLGYTFPSFEDPQSIFIPGSYFLGDLKDAMDAQGFFESAGEGLGFRFLKPGERDPISEIFRPLF